ncbi:hypothetical protein [Solidesulfovibrio sp.]
MATIMPQGELTRRAVTWIDEQRELTGKPFAALIDQAAMQFNLSPRDTEFLARFFTEREEPRP